MSGVGPVLNLYRSLIGKADDAPSASPRDIAILRLDNLGDAILTSGLIAALRKHWPTARITVFCSEVAAPFFRLCPEVNSAVPLPGINPRDMNAAAAVKCFQRFRETYEGRFDVLINPRPGPDYYCAALYAAATQAPRRIGFMQVEHVSGFDPNPGYTDLATIPASYHPAFVGQHLLERLGIKEQVPEPRLILGNAVQAWAKKLLPQPPYVAFGIGASLPYKIWPPPNFALIANYLMSCGYKVLLLGGPKERPLADQIGEALSAPAVDMVGSTKVDEMAALISRCAFFVGNDSAPKHLAGIAGVPIVEITFFGDRSEGFVGDRLFTAVGAPFVRVGPQSRFTVQETYAGLGIQAVTPQQVREAIERLMTIAGDKIVPAR